MSSKQFFFLHLLENQQRIMGLIMDIFLLSFSCENKFGRLHLLFYILVDPSDAPDYYTKVERPMDFGTIRKKLEVIITSITVFIWSQEQCVWECWLLVPSRLSPAWCIHVISGHLIKVWAHILPILLFCLIRWYIHVCHKAVIYKSNETVCIFFYF